MANEQHLDVIKKGVTKWNEWREQNPEIQPDLNNADFRSADLAGANLSGVDLSGVDLSNADLSNADLSWANLRNADLKNTDLNNADLSNASLIVANLGGANLNGANLREANLSWADFSNVYLSGVNLSGVNLKEANLNGANLSGANLSDADLSNAYLNGADLSNAYLSNADLRGADLRSADLAGANLGGANLIVANLSNANLSSADLSRANMVETNFHKANLTECRIYGVSAWDLKLQETKQLDLIITPYEDPAITVDNLEVAQFVYLLLKNEKLRDVIDTITSKVVLILGRFTPERKVILDALKEELRKRNYVPILFDFEKPSSRNTTETITLLARMARFIIADITDAKSIPQELHAIVPNLPSVPVQPLLECSQKEYGMFESFSSYPWVLETYYYDSISEVLASINEKVISPSEAKLSELKKSSSQNSP